MSEPAGVDKAASAVITDAVLADLARLAGSDAPFEERAESIARVLAEAGCTCAVRWWYGAHPMTLAAAGPALVALMSPEPDTLLGLVRAAQTVHVPDLAAYQAGPGEEGWLAIVQAAGLGSLCLLPLGLDGCVEGLLALAHEQPASWTALDSSRAALLAHLALAPLSRPGHAPAVDLGDPYRDAVVAMHLDRDADDVCRRAVDQARRMLGADWVMVARKDGDDRFADCHFAVERLSLALADSPLLARVFESQVTVVDPVDNIGNDLLLQRLAQAGIASSLTVPMVFQGQSFGALQVGYRASGKATPDARHVAEHLAFHCALALRDARLLENQEHALSRLRQAQQEATEGTKFRALAQMAGGVAHEFNNALGGILARAQMLQRQTQDRRILKGLGTIAEIGWRAAETVRRLQEFTRERSEEDFEPLIVEALWQRLSDAVRQQVSAFGRATGSRYHVELEADQLEGVLLANCDELVEAVSNLVTNAIEATPGGGVVMLHAATVRDHLHLVVVDRGRGMTPEELQSCFDPFFSSKAETGVGLGLSVTYGIISRHRGEVEIESLPGQGTTVSISLPLTGEQDAARDHNPHILVIDDEEALCEVLSELFSTAGYTVDTCAGGREGIERFGATPYDLVCTDLRTEDLSGWEVIRAIKESGRGTPVMLLTGFREQLRPEQIEESGVDAVLGKPFTLQQVLEAAGKLLGTSAG